MTLRLRATAALAAALMSAVIWTGIAAADSLPGCASGAAPGHVVFTVSVSASGTPFVSSYVASPPTSSGNVGCAAAPAPAPTISVTGPSVAAFPNAPVLVGPVQSGTPVVPVPVNMIQVGSYLLTVPTTPGMQVYQIAPGYYVVRSTDATQNASVIMFPLPGTPQAPNTGPIPSVIH